MPAGCSGRARRASGNHSEFALRVYGEKGGLHWRRSAPDRLLYSELGRPAAIITRGSRAAGAAAGRITRMPAGHPEGYLEAFATVYAEIAQAIRAGERGEALPGAVWYPDARDGLDGVMFVDAVVRSSVAGSLWAPLQTVPA